MESKSMDANAWTVKRLLEWTSEYLGRAGVEQSRLAAEILLAHVLGWARIDLYVRYEEAPGAGELGRFRELVKRAAGHEPVAYLTGLAHFYSMEFKVNEAVLIPRPETEVLVAEAVGFCRHETLRPRVDVLDLGTGSGCVGVTIAKQVVEAEVVAVDVSEAALEVARENAARHGVEERVEFVRGDLFEGVEASGKGVFDLIVSNPPYISDAEFAELDATVRDYEPVEALRGGADGLDYYRRIVAGAEEYLAEGAGLMVEVGHEQAGAVSELFEGAGYLGKVEVVRDAAGHKRVVKARRM